jgi:hypothetical protein
MSRSVLERVSEDTFVELILSDELRRELLALLRRRAASAPSAAALIGVVASKCVATPGQLREAIDVLRAEGSSAADVVLFELLMHPDVPEGVLLRFVDDDRFLAALGHRRGPRGLLEALAKKHRYPEAITTLALMHYGTKQAPAPAFREFLREYADVPMLEYNLQRPTQLDASKQRIVREVFGIDREMSSARRKPPRR